MAPSRSQSGYKINMDACNEYIGCEPLQKQLDGTDRLVVSWTRSFDDAEQAYDTTYNKRTCNSMGSFVASVLFESMSAHHPHWSRRTQMDSEPGKLDVYAGTLPNTTIKVSIRCCPPCWYNESSNWRVIATKNYWNQSDAHPGQDTGTVHRGLHPPWKERSEGFEYAIRQCIKRQRRWGATRSISFATLLGPEHNKRPITVP